MPEYEVKWRIEVDADSFEDAAKEADYSMRAPDSFPPIFEVVDKSTGIKKDIDMQEHEAIEL